MYGRAHLCFYFREYGMKQTILVDGKSKEIDVRLMDESFIVYRKMYRPPLTPDNIDKINLDDWAEHLERFKREGWQQIIEEFFSKANSRNRELRHLSVGWRRRHR